MELKLVRGQFFGQVLRSHELSAITLTETRYPLGHKLPRHSHERAYFCFVLRGTFTESYGQQSHVRKPAMLIFHPPGEPHSDYFQTEVHCFNVQIDAHWHQQPIGLDQSVSFHGGPLSYLATKIYREFREMDQVSGLAIEGLALEMIAEATRAINNSEHTSQPWLAQARDMLHAHFAERLTIAHLAAAVGVHPTHLARAFRRRHRRTVGEYVRQLRIEFACRQLSSSDTPLSEVAIAAGFFDQSHFSRTFKLITGMSPAAYRQAFRIRSAHTKR